MKARKKWNSIAILALALATISMMAQSVVAGFFDGWAKKPGYGGGYFEPQRGR